MTKHYHLSNIRTLLTEGFTDDELRRLCYDIPDFRPIYDELSPETGKSKIIDRLIEYANQKLRLEDLLAWAKQHNPARYEAHQPYHISPVNPFTSADSYEKYSKIEPTKKVVKREEIYLALGLAIAIFSCMAGWLALPQIQNLWREFIPISTATPSLAINTNTPQPPTLTPPNTQKPIDTPIPTPTNSPVPKLTNTPKPSTAAPTPVPTNTSKPINTPIPKPTSTPKPANTPTQVILPLELNLPAKAGWIKTRVSLESGQSVLITANGNVDVCSGCTDGFGKSTPDGNGVPCDKAAIEAAVNKVYELDCLLSQVPHGAVIGRIGNSKAFLIGSISQARATELGELFLAVNDCCDLTDNVGAYSVIISLP